MERNQTISDLAEEYYREFTDLREHFLALSDEWQGACVASYNDVQDRRLTLLRLCQTLRENTEA